MTGKQGSGSITAFPTADQKAFAQGKIKEIPKRVIYTYWTNFDNRSPETWQLLHIEPDEFAFNEKGHEFWSFKTNITPDDFAFMWNEAKTRIFLRRMWDIYRYRKTSS